MKGLLFLATFAYALLCDRGRSTNECPIVCDSTSKDCKCEDTDLKNMGCFLFNSSSEIQNRCDIEKPIKFLYHGFCIDEEVICAGTEGYETYTWCPWIFRHIWNIHARIFNCLTFNVWPLHQQSCSYVTYKTPLGIIIKPKNAVMRDCSEHCYVQSNLGIFKQKMAFVNEQFLSRIQNGDLDDLFNHYEPRGTKEDEKVLATIKNKLQHLSDYHEDNDEYLKTKWSQLKTWFTVHRNAHY